MTAADAVAAGSPGFRVDVFTLFPEVIDHYGSASVLGRARGTGRLDLRTHDIRESTHDVHRTVDDAPFGGGAGMVLAPGPVFEAVEAVAAGPGGLPRPLLVLSASGARFDQRMAGELAASPVGFSLLCGRYEGVDQRVADHLCDGELSIGDYVLAGGELAALVVVEAVARLLPGVLGNEQSADEESHCDGPARVPAVHPARRLPGPGRARGAPVRRPREGGGVATGAVPGQDVAAPSRPDRRAGWAHRGGGRPAPVPR